MDKQIGKEYLAGKFERTEEGIYFPSSRMLAQGVFSVNKRGEPVEYCPNLVVTEGLDYILAAAIGKTSVTSNWYIMPYSGNVTVLATWVGATVHTTATEWTNYDSATRPLWDISAASVSAGGIDSFAAKAEFISDTNTQTVYGAALVSGVTKSSASTTLIAASNFPSVKNLDDNEVLDIGYGLQLTPV